MCDEGKAWSARDAAEHRAHARVTQPEPEPERDGDVQSDQDVRQERIAETQVRRDRAAELPGPEHGAERRGARDEVEGEQHELDQRERQEHGGAKPSFRAPSTAGGRARSLTTAFAPRKAGEQPLEDASGPAPAVGGAAGGRVGSASAAGSSNVADMAEGGVR